MTPPASASASAGSCVDEWTGGNCTHHYMTLGGGPMVMTVDAADDWCNTNSSCHGFTFKTGAATTGPGGGKTEIYFRDETQIFFMDSQINELTGKAASPEWTSHVSQARAAPLRMAGCNASSCTSGLQVWVKDVSTANGPGL
eukprot:SAG22_NODE_8729_length_634_cov_1.321495_1_plen_141_part_10